MELNWVEEWQKVREGVLPSGKVEMSWKKLWLGDNLPIGERLLYTYV